MLVGAICSQAKLPLHSSKPISLIKISFHLYPEQVEIVVSQDQTLSAQNKSWKLPNIYLSTKAITAFPCMKFRMRWAFQNAALYYHFKTRKTGRDGNTNQQHSDRNTIQSGTNRRMLLLNMHQPNFLPGRSISI